MSAQHFIALDTHCEFCEMVAVSNSGKIVKRERCATTIPALGRGLGRRASPADADLRGRPAGGLAGPQPAAARRAADRVRAAAECPDRQGGRQGRSDRRRTPGPTAPRRLSQRGASAAVAGPHRAQAARELLPRPGARASPPRASTGGPAAAARRVCLDRRRASIPRNGPRLWKKLPPRKVLRTDLDLFLQVYELLVRAGRGAARRTRSAWPAAKNRSAVFRSCPASAGFARSRSTSTSTRRTRFASKAALWRYCGHRLGTPT